MQKLITISLIILLTQSKAELMNETTPRQGESCPELQLTLTACDKALRAAEAELEARKQQGKALAEYAAQVEEQRDRAYERAEDKSWLPGWAWVLLGAAGATVLIGVRR